MSATVVATQTVGPLTRLVQLEVAGGLGFVGGQYLIVDSGVTLPNGKRAKRAYSIVSADVEQQRVQLAVKRLGGPGSAFLHAVEPGDQVPFSGPWGKLLPDDARPRRTLVLATDTGITAALGLVRGERFEPQIAGARLVWIVSPEERFLPDGLVRELLPRGLRYERVVAADRDAAAQAVAAEAAGCDSAFLTGDGAVIYPLREALPVPRDAVRLEAFFNNPERRSA